MLNKVRQLTALQLIGDLAKALLLQVLPLLHGQINLLRQKTSSLVLRRASPPLLFPQNSLANFRFRLLMCKSKALGLLTHLDQTLGFLDQGSLIQKLLLSEEMDPVHAQFDVSQIHHQTHEEFCNFQRAQCRFLPESRQQMDARYSRLSGPLVLLNHQRFQRYV